MRMGGIWLFSSVELGDEDGFESEVGRGGWEMG